MYIPILLLLTLTVLNEIKLNLPQKSDLLINHWKIFVLAVAARYP